MNFSKCLGSGLHGLQSTAVRLVHDFFWTSPSEHCRRTDCQDSVQSSPRLPDGRTGLCRTLSVRASSGEAGTSVPHGYAVPGGETGAAPHRAVLSTSLSQSILVPNCAHCQKSVRARTLRGEAGTSVLRCGGTSTANGTTVYSAGRVGQSDRLGTVRYCKIP